MCYNSYVLVLSSHETQICALDSITKDENEWLVCHFRVIWDFHSPVFKGITLSRNFGSEMVYQINMASYPRKLQFHVMFALYYSVFLLRLWPFWVVTPCRFTGVHQRLRQTHRLHPQSWRHNTADHNLNVQSHKQLKAYICVHNYSVSLQLHFVVCKYHIKRKAHKTGNVRVT